jgi:hypothetical protein
VGEAKEDKEVLGELQTIVRLLLSCRCLSVQVPLSLVLRQGKCVEGYQALHRSRLPTFSRMCVEWVG